MNYTQNVPDYNVLGYGCITVSTNMIISLSSCWSLNYPIEKFLEPNVGKIIQHDWKKSISYSCICFKNYSLRTRDVPDQKFYPTMQKFSAKKKI